MEEKDWHAELDPALDSSIFPPFQTSCLAAKAGKPVLCPDLWRAILGFGYPNNGVGIVLIEEHSGEGIHGIEFRREVRVRS